MTHCVGLVTGETEMCILAKKISSQDIEVRFCCERTNWEANATLVNPRVHKGVDTIFFLIKFFVFHQTFARNL